MMIVDTQEVIQKISHDNQLSLIQQMDRASCIVMWRKLHGRHPPNHLSIQFLRKSLLFETQVKNVGGYSKTLRRMFKHTLNGNGHTENRTNPLTTVLKPGMHLVREWNGKTYQVKVTEEDFVMNGRNYQSLSAIAKHITGAHWSGPRFFGLSSVS